MYKVQNKPDSIKADGKCDECGSFSLLISRGVKACRDCDHVIGGKEKRPEKGKKVIKKCKQCSVDFESPSSKMRSFCSHACSNTHGNQKRSRAMQKKLNCLACKKTFFKRPSDVKIYPGSLAKNKYRYCSHACWRTKAQTISSLKIRAWGIFGTYIKNRDNWTCYTCGKYEKGAQMHAGHYISRRHNATLFDEDNVHAQCSSCNMFNNGQPHLYAERIIAEHGVDFLLALTEKSRTPKKFTKQELLELYDKYKTLNNGFKEGARA